MHKKITCKGKKFKKKFKRVITNQWNKRLKSLWINKDE